MSSIADLRTASLLETLIADVWRSDTGRFGGTPFSGWPFPRERRIKVLTSLFDTAVDGGAT